MDDELARVRAERDALLEHDVETWLADVKANAVGMRAFESSLSWRVTKPLRAAGAFARLTRSDGLGTAVSTAAGVVRKRVQRG